MEQQFYDNLPPNKWFNERNVTRLIEHVSERFSIRWEANSTSEDLLRLRDILNRDTWVKGRHLREREVSEYLMKRRKWHSFNVAQAHSFRPPLVRRAIVSAALSFVDEALNEIEREPSSLLTYRVGDSSLPDVLAVFEYEGIGHRRVFVYGIPVLPPDFIGGHWLPPAAIKERVRDLAYNAPAEMSYSERTWTFFNLEAVFYLDYKTGAPLDENARLHANTLFSDVNGSPLGRIRSGLEVEAFYGRPQLSDGVFWRFKTS
jgi:hypothetical protein